MLVFLLAAVFGPPFWFWVSKRVDKKRTFMTGAILWTTTQLSLFLVLPDWPRWVGFAGIPFAGFGFTAVDIMPGRWSEMSLTKMTWKLASGARGSIMDF